uniref:Secreted protein n=1 Tax=Amblyomma triste TaxID=251400 RepID=A0A023G4T4_AMBTT
MIDAIVMTSCLKPWLLFLGLSKAVAVNALTLSSPFNSFQDESDVLDVGQTWSKYLLVAYPLSYACPSCFYQLRGIFLCPYFCTSIHHWYAWNQVLAEVLVYCQHLSGFNSWKYLPLNFAYSDWYACGVSDDTAGLCFLV